MKNNYNLFRMESNFTDDDYYLFKVQQLLLVTYNPKELIKENPLLKSRSFLETFYYFIDVYSKNNLLSDRMKNNVFNYLKELKDDDTTINGANYDIINKIILKINGQEFDNSIDYYRCEMYIRTGARIYINNKKLKDKEILEEEQNLFESIAFDQRVLYACSTEVSDFVFENAYLLQFSLDENFYNTLNCILNEYPAKFLDDLFCSRCLQILNHQLNISDLLLTQRNVKELINKIQTTVFKQKVKSRFRKIINK